MAAFGVKDFKPPEWMLEAESPQELEVLEENWDAVHAFLACATQWDRSRDDRPIGIRYEALEIVMRRMRLADPDDVFWRVRVMENAAVREFATLKSKG